MLQEISSGKPINKNHMKKITINLEDEDNSYILSDIVQTSPPLSTIIESNEIQDNYFIINPENSVILQEINQGTSSGNNAACIIPIVDPQSQFVTYNQMVNYVTQRLLNYIIISAIAPENPVEGQLWIQI